MRTISSLFVRPGYLLSVWAPYFDAIVSGNLAANGLFRSVNSFIASGAGLEWIFRLPLRVPYTSYRGLSSEYSCCVESRRGSRFSNSSTATRTMRPFMTWRYLE